MMSNVIPLNAWRGSLDVGEKGVKRNLTNLMLHLQNLEGLGSSIRFNELTMQAEWNGHPLSEEDMIDIRLIIERAGFQPIEKDVRPAIMRLARENAFHPVCDYLNGLKWDGKPRCDAWLVKLLGAPDTPYVRSVGPKSLIAAVARAYDPGCKVDTMLVLEGDQGLRKSSAIAALFGQSHTFEVVSGFDNHRQFANGIIGAWAVELAEFVSVTRTNSGVVKGLITMRRDRVQLPYARSLSDLPRRFVFVGTINPGSAGYLDDDTGNRRYWPVPVSRCDIAGIERWRDQIWAEARDRFRANERWWLEGDEESDAAAMVEERNNADPWTEVLARKLIEQPRQQITSSEALSLLGVPTDRMDKSAQMRVATALKFLGYVRKSERVPKGKPRRFWEKTV